MITYNPKSWLKLIFAFHKSDTLRIMWKEIIYMGVLSVLLTYLEITYIGDSEVLEKLITVYSIIGFVISLLLVFRTNTAYDRWWEGRKKWGCMVNDSRNLAIKISVLNISENDKDFFKRMIPNFVYAMKEHLRLGTEFSELNLTETEKRSFDNVIHEPAHIVLMMTKKLKSLAKQGLITQEELIVIDKNLNALLDNLGACERIKNTPIPFSYSLFIKKFIFIYTTTLPLAFVTTFGYYSALIAVFVFYVLVSIEILAEEIEDPFGNDANDLPTDGLSKKIKDNVNEIFKNEKVEY